MKMLAKATMRRASMIVIMAGSAFLTACGGDAYTSAELTSMYPDISAASTKVEEVEVLCPFQRMLKRSGIPVSYTHLTLPTKRIV